MPQKKKRSPKGSSGGSKRQKRTSSSSSSTSVTSSKSGLLACPAFLETFEAGRTLINSSSAHEDKILLHRIYPLNNSRFEGQDITSPSSFNNLGEAVVYWCTREHRVQDNWSLTVANTLALGLNRPLYVCFVLSQTTNYAPVCAPTSGSKLCRPSLREADFMVNGLHEMKTDLQKYSVPFYLLKEQKKSTAETVLDHLDKVNATCVVTDFSPLRVHRQAWETVSKKAKVPVCVVDSHNIVPCWITSPKQEYAARTIRSKIHKKLPHYLCKEAMGHVHEELRLLRTQNDCNKALPSDILSGSNLSSSDSFPTNWKVDEALKWCKPDRSIPPITYTKPGAAAGHKRLKAFIQNSLKYFASDRNDPTKPNVISGLSPYFHFGQLSPQRAVVEVMQKSGKGRDAFVEEAVVRRELTDNFLFYRPKDYDTLLGMPSWAQTSLQLHAKDSRNPCYTCLQLEQAETKDPLWNAAQNQMVRDGKMHGFMRMYWAKKILEWTSSPSYAFKTALYLNDRYSIDGKDPNGYVGCAWSIAGLHDQGWREREIFGKVRYMNYKGCQRKFDVAKFEKKYA
eukprot:g1108.t1